MYLVSVITEEKPSAPDPRSSGGFAELVNLHHRDVLVYARSLTREVNTARDLVQDAFVTAYQKWDTFDSTRDFGAWMRGIIRNKWREALRKSGRLEVTDDDAAMIDAEMAAWQSRQVKDDSTLFDALEHCLERLPDNLKLAVRVFYYEGQTGDETAQSLNIAPAAVRKRLQRARTLLKDCVDSQLGQPSSP